MAREARPKRYPAPEFPVRRPAPFSRVPPAVFPVILGLLGLGLALRRGLAAVDLPGGLAELVLGAAGALWVFAAFVYGVKLVRRRGVLAEDLRVLPGRGGIAAGTVGGMAVAAAMVPYAPVLAGGLLIAALVLHAVQGMVLARVLWHSPAGRLNPTLHLSYVGFIVGGLAAAGLGWQGLALALFWGTLPVAVGIWGLSAAQFAREVPPAPLRPLLAIHLAPASLLSLVAGVLGYSWLAVGFAVLGGVVLVTLVLSVRWITAPGFTPMWGAFTFPLAAYATALFGVGWDWPGVGVLVAALGVIPAIAWSVLKMWPDGSLAARTNAAVA